MLGTPTSAPCGFAETLRPIAAAQSGWLVVSGVAGRVGGGCVSRALSAQVSALSGFLDRHVGCRTAALPNRFGAAGLFLVPS